MRDEYSAHLSDQEYDVLVKKATDRPGDGGYTNTFDDGVYHCRACGAPLYKSDSKFHSGCGWPSFDTEIPGAVLKRPDSSYGMIRTEIVCANCGGHLGHVFEGEHYTATNTRHCVNTSSIIFHPRNTEEAYIEVGDFARAQFVLQGISGVLFTEVGTVDDAAGAQTRVIRVECDPSKVSVRSLIDTLRKASQTSSATDAHHVWFADDAHGEQVKADLASLHPTPEIGRVHNYTRSPSADQQLMLRAQHAKH